ncbi:ParA family protein [Ciceribacter sp. T2.26MG-112.2]|uniref:ParA family protein n=1 Tax=Ciceribacter sp. T2.26MG-112.2 TaxID=3137154 RepID=UPI001AECBD9B|nr:ParA family protein [Ciceribacter naphthalenivorans]
MTVEDGLYTHWIVDSFGGVRMTVISVVNMKGGVAKTTLATNLADTLVRRHQCKVLLVDLDPQFNATQCLISPEKYVKARSAGQPTIVNIFDDAPMAVSAVGGAKSQAPLVLKDIKPWKIKENFDLVPGDLELYRLEMGGGQGREQRLKRYLEAIGADEKYDFVIIDTPPTPSHWMMAALLASDGYIVPVKPEPLSRTGIDLLRGVVERFSQNYGHPIECIGVVLTIVETNTLVYREAVDFLDKNPVWAGKRYAASLPKRVKLARAQGNQALIFDLDDSDLKRGIAGIAKEFTERADG